jgi:nucleotidyltransferase substrate binding protein (TIGR01987 family)
VSETQDTRWQQRFQNFDRSFARLRSALENGPGVLNALEKEGSIRRFGDCFELAWKTVKDHMEANGWVFATITPRQVLKDAFAAKVLPDGQVWMDMLDHRNLLSHTYSSDHFQEAVEAIHRRYLPAFSVLHGFLQTEAKR